MHQPSNKRPSLTALPAALRASLRQWSRRHGRAVCHQMLRGAAYSAGSGAVSLFVVWFQNHM
ncbi:hypothetical protein ABT160_33245 [Streptomyces sp. NPDC001941]|uniref:hypothetical protein n=1 Tax=Streptomyces sp. NPDC001941 TaxID=3154659 RepID=UPI0033194BEC